MRESRLYGSVRGALGDQRSYRDPKNADTLVASIVIQRQRSPHRSAPRMKLHYLRPS